MTFVTCGNCRRRVATTAIMEHSFTCQRAAKAIEAQRAETAKIGSVHESAIPKGFAQLPSDEGGE